MKALNLTASRRRDKVVILSGVRYGSKLSTPAKRGRKISPFAAFCLQMLVVLFAAMGGLLLFLTGHTLAFIALLMVGIVLIIINCAGL